MLVPQAGQVHGIGSRKLRFGPCTLDFVQFRLELGDAPELDVEVACVLSNRVEDFSELVTSHIHRAVGGPRTTPSALGRHRFLPLALCSEVF
jgi:hypothetical protein